MMFWLNTFNKPPGHLYGQILLLLVMLTNSCYAAKGQPIRFVTEIMPPYQMQQGRELSGFAIELMEEVIRRSGIEADISVYPWARAYHLALTEPNTFIFTIVKTKERLNQFNWVDEYYASSDSFYALSSRRDIVLNDIEGAKKYLTCIPSSDVSEQRLTQWGFTSKHLKKVAGQTQCLGMLYRKRVDLNLFNDSNVASFTADANVEAGSLRRVLVVSKSVLGLAASKTTDLRLVDKVRKALQQVKSEPAFQQKIQQWFDPKRR